MTRVAIIGAGIGGLTAALLLAARGCEVTLCEAAATPGGKLHTIILDGVAIDSGPTVLTLRPVFESIFAEAGLSLADHLDLTPLDCLARHAWEDGSGLDLFPDTARNADAIGVFAGLEAARGYAAFALKSRQIFETLEPSFLQVPQPGLGGLMRRAGPGLARVSPFTTLWGALAGYFKDARLRQLFARYATYCGSSPFSAPATLMLIAHAEQRGVWRIEGGMQQLAEAFATQARALGAVLHLDTPVAEILARNGRVSGVRLAEGEIVAADYVIANADLTALGSGLFGSAAREAVAGMLTGAKPSLSAVTFAATGSHSGFDLAHHNLFFSNDCGAEFGALAAGRIPGDPTVYLCAPGPGRYFALINAPPGASPGTGEVEDSLSATLLKMRNCGLELDIAGLQATGPTDFARRFPASRGALYGRALTGWRDSFNRPGARTRLPGLLLAGGSVHPGPGLPMAALSGRVAAHCVLAKI